METHRLILPEDLNQYGFLFGGRLLAWVDEASWIAASLEFPAAKFVTVGMDRVEFHHSVKEGTILAIHCEQTRRGTTSVTYAVTVRDGKSAGAPIFSTRVTFVSVPLKSWPMYSVPRCPTSNVSGPSRPDALVTGVPATGACACLAWCTLTWCQPDASECWSSS